MIGVCEGGMCVGGVCKVGEEVGMVMDKRLWGWCVE